MKEIIITCNSPGEVASWLRVTLPEIRKRAPEVKITVTLVLCPYASGAEKSVVARLGYLDELYSPWETVGLLLKPGRRAARGLVVFLGGDPWHALLLAKRFGYATTGYFEKPDFWSKKFDRPLFSRSGENVVGNLMLDGLESATPRRREDIGLDPTRPVIGLFPGSRPIHLRVTLGHYLAICESLAATRPDLQFVLIRSPFVNAAGLQKGIDKPWRVGLPVSHGTAYEDAIVCDSGLRIPVVSGLPGEVFPLFDVAMTVPGTNTAELACRAKPFLVTLHRLAFFGGGGLVGLLERSSLVPNALKVKMRERKYARYHSLLAHPNILAGRIIAPEVIIGEDTRELERQVLAVLDDVPGREAMGRELQAAMGQSGAAARFAEAVVGQLEKL